MDGSRNLAGRVGRWSARHRRTAVLGWLAFVLAAVAVGAVVPQGELTAAEQTLGAPARAQQILAGNGWEEPASEMVLVQRDADVPEAAATAALTDLVDGLRGTPEVTHLVSPLDGAPLASADGRSALVTFDITGDAADADERIGPIVDVVADVADRHGDVRVEQFGGTSADLALSATLDADFERAELLSIPITLAVLLLTVLPAMMAWLGDRVEKGRLPFRRRRQAGPGRVWPAVLGAVLRRPLVSAVVAGAALVGLAVPALSMDLRAEGVQDLPQDLAVILTYNRITEAFPGGPSPAEVVVEAPDVAAPAVQSAIADLRAQALAGGQMNEPIAVETNEAGTVAVVSVPLVGDGEEQASREALATLADDLVPATVGAIDGVTAVVSGSTAYSVAFDELMADRTPWVFAFVLVLAFVLLLVSFRSVTVAVVAIVLDLLSVAAAYGVLVLVFEEGVGADLIGLDRIGAIVNWIPLFLFVILFGLSMDYHVFILSRIREARDRGRSTADAVAEGITSSAGVVTSAAVIMVFVFATFVTLSMTSMKQIGLGLAIAVLLDATVVRAVLLPAVMQLLGERNWYLPRWLQWLPAARHEAPPAPGAVVPEPRREADRPLALAVDRD